MHHSYFNVKTSPSPANGSKQTVASEAPAVLAAIVLLLFAAEALMPDIVGGAACNLLFIIGGGIQAAFGIVGPGAGRDQPDMLPGYDGDNRGIEAQCPAETLGCANCMCDVEAALGEVPKVVVAGVPRWRLFKVVALRPKGTFVVFGLKGACSADIDSKSNLDEFDGPTPGGRAGPPGIVAVVVIGVVEDIGANRSNGTDFCEVVAGSSVARRSISSLL